MSIAINYIVKKNYIIDVNLNENFNLSVDDLCVYTMFAQNIHGIMCMVNYNLNI